MREAEITIKVAIPSDCDRATVNPDGEVRAWSEDASVHAQKEGWFSPTGFSRGLYISNWKETLTEVSDEPRKQTVDDQTTSAAPALFRAVQYLIRRIHRDPNLQYYCGACTESLRLLSDAYAQATGKNAEEIERAAATADCGEAHVLELKRQIRELEDDK